MTELDKNIKVIHKSTIDDLFSQFSESIEHIQDIMKTNVEISYFYLDSKLQTMTSAMEKFKSDNNLKIKE